MKAPLWQRTLAEGFGVFALVTAGCGAVLVQQQTGALGHLGVSLAFGLVIGIMVAATGHVSGAHLNPAVTLAFAVVRHFPWREVAAYLAAQLAGALAGAAALLAVLGAQGSLGATVPAGSAAQSFGVELLLTAGLMFAITAVATDTRAVGQLAALVIGGAVALGAVVGGPLSGASMNPARSFGPALLSGTWEHHWVYWLGPIAGAIAGAAAYQLLKLPAPVAPWNRVR